MNDSAHWFDDDDFWQTFYHTMFDSRSFEQARQECPRLLALAGTESPRVLDLACGPGRHAVPLAALGLDVTGVDLSQALLQKAQCHARQAGVTVHWEKEDMRHFRRPGHYDLILNLFSSFGYFTHWQDNQKVLELTHENLAAGGTLILDVRGKERILRELQPVHAQEFDNEELHDCVLYQRPFLSDDMTRLHNEWTLVCPHGVHRHEYSHFIYTAQELRMMAQDAGFTTVEVYGSLDAEPYDLDAERLLLVARKRGL